MQEFLCLEHFYFLLLHIRYKKSSAGTNLKRLLPLLILFFFLLFFPRQTLEASKSGLLLWFDSILPTLLPFLIVSGLILKTSLSDYFQKYLGPAFRRLFHCSDSGAFCLLCGLLCGYPVGARLIALQLQEDQLSLEEGQYLLSFCNQTSPAFISSYVVMQKFQDSTLLFPTLLILYTSSFLCSFLFRKLYKIERPHFQINDHLLIKNIYPL